MKSTVTIELSDFDRLRNESLELHELKHKIKNGLELKHVTVNYNWFINISETVYTNDEFIIKQQKKIESLEKKIESKKWYQFIKI